MHVIYVLSCLFPIGSNGAVAAAAVLFIALIVAALALVGSTFKICRLKQKLCSQETTGTISRYHKIRQ